MEDYILLNKAIFFPKPGILAITDVHLGYEQMLEDDGILIPFNQLEQSIGDLKKIQGELISKGHKIKKVIILGDLKHHFAFNMEETFEIRDFVDFIRNTITTNIIALKGSHEKMSVGVSQYEDYHLDGSLAFIHGDINFPEVFDKKIKTIVMGHLHPAISLSDNVKSEKFKCYLTGQFQKKDVIILPSFMPLFEGAELTNTKDFSIIPKEKLQNFKVHIIGDDRVYEFGKLKQLNRE